MISGILAGIFWAIDTVILGIALSMTPFVSTEQAIVLAPFVSTFLHDFFSAIYSWIYNAIRGNFKKSLKVVKTKSFKWVVLASAIGGPIGMTGYILSISYMGASIGAIASAIFPAIGAILARIFLKEKMKWYQWIFLLACLGGVYGLSYSPDINITNFWLGLIGTLMCAIGWGVEAVIIAHGLKDPEMTDEIALQTRQTTSCLIYAALILPIMKGWGFTISLFNFITTKWLIPLIALAAIFGTASYICYYASIRKIGASKAMALNVSYVAWAIVFGLIVSRDISSVSWVTIVCGIAVLVCGILAATDFKNFKKASKLDS